MKIPSPFWPGIRVVAIAGLVLSFVVACKPAVKPAAPAKPAAAATHAAPSTTNVAFAANVSVFEQLVPPKGRDPFFPGSHRRDPEPAKGPSPDKPIAASELVLKGIVGSPNHRLALINDNTIMEVGENGSVRVPTGHVHLTCLEIGADYAVIKVEGEIQTKRLQLSKKGL
jgi:hypothetical protein